MAFFMQSAQCKQVYSNKISTYISTYISKYIGKRGKEKARRVRGKGKVYYISIYMGKGEKERGKKEKGKGSKKEGIGERQRERSKCTYNNTYYICDSTD
jgi:hypothetical protein